MEREADKFTKERLACVQQEMSDSSQELVEIHKELQGRRKLEENRGSSATDNFDCTDGVVGNAETGGDIEMQRRSNPNRKQPHYERKQNSEFSERRLPHGNIGTDCDLEWSISAQSLLESSESSSRYGVGSVRSVNIEKSVQDHDHDRRRSEHVLRQSMSFRAPQGSSGGAGGKKTMGVDGRDGAALADTRNSVVNARSDIPTVESADSPAASSAESTLGLVDLSEWKEVFDESSNMRYFHNEKTGTTTWESPFESTAHSFL